jgi:IS1 family transposase
MLANGMNWKHLSGQKHKIWVWTAVDHFPKGILASTLGDHSAETFEPRQVAWQCYFYVTDGWTVYPSFIPDGDQSISKTSMTRVEGENSRLGHYLARLLKPFAIPSL